MMISTVRGTFERFLGTVEADEQNPTAAKVNMQIEVASINTRDEKRDGQLGSPDFFNAAEYSSWLSLLSRAAEERSFRQPMRPGT
jgi:polyisoprenoid-binding protein YceI